MKAGTPPSSSLPFSGTSTPSLSVTGDSNEASTEVKVWSGNAEICSEETPETTEDPPLLPAQLVPVVEEGTVSGAPTGPLVEEMDMSEPPTDPSNEGNQHKSM